MTISISFCHFQALNSTDMSDGNAKCGKQKVLFIFSYAISLKKLDIRILLRIGYEITAWYAIAFQ